MRSLASAARLLLECTDRPTARRWFATNLMAVAGGLLSGLAPLALKGLIDGIGAPSQASPLSSSMTALAALYLLCLVLGRVLSELRPALASAAEQRLYGRLRQRVFQHSLNLPLNFHLNERAGAVTHALQQGISGYQIIMYSVLNGIIPVLVEACTVTLVLLSLGQPVLTIIFGATAILYMAAASSRSRALASAAERISTVSADASSHFSEGLTNIEPVKCFGAESRLVADFAKAASMLESRWSDFYGQRLRSGLCVLAVFVISICASLAAAIHAFHLGTLSLGGLVLANMYMVQVLRPLDMLVAAARDVAQGLAFIGPMLKVLETSTEASATGRQASFAAKQSPAAVSVDKTRPDKSTATSVPPSAPRPPRIQFKGVKLSLDGRNAVFTDLNLDIPAGRSIAIVGESGCGKSTLARLLLRLWTQESGAILWDGRMIDSLGVEALRSKIAFVPQDTVLFNRSISANIAIGKPDATQQEIEHAARLAQLHDVVTALPCGYGTVIGERGMKLSGGERQRIAIARAILRDPLVYIFDEATSMLDGPTERAILKDFGEISTGRTTIMIAHRLSVLRFSDKIAVLGRGSVIEHGSHGDLLTRGGAYAALWRAQPTGPAG